MKPATFRMHLRQMCTADFQQYLRRAARFPVLSEEETKEVLYEASIRMRDLGRAVSKSKRGGK